nr:sporulation protein [Neobacillus sp. Marseille-Q6967]
MVHMNRILFVLCLFTLSACTQEQQVKDSQLSLMKTTNPNPIVTQQHNSPHHVQDIEKTVSDYDELYDVAVIEGKKETLVVYKVKHMQRFRMKKIEKNLTKELEEKYPDDNFIVSSDYKIFLEAVRLNERREAGNLSDKAADKRLNEIIKMTKDMK